MIRARSHRKRALGPFALLWAVTACSEPAPSPEAILEEGAQPAEQAPENDPAVAAAPEEASGAAAGEAASEPAAAASEPSEQRAGAVHADTRRMLEELGYVPALPTGNPEDRGVTVHEPEAFDGLSLFSSRHRARALLIDMDGNEVHRWEAEDAGSRSWMHVEPLPNGDILAISKSRDLARHAWDSSVVWRRPLPVHHDLAIREDGTIYALIRRRDAFELDGEPVPAIGDGIAVLSPEGEVQRRVWLLPLLRGIVSRSRVARVRARLEQEPISQVVRAGGLADLLHANSIAILGRDIPDVAPAGSILLSLRTPSRVAILDAELEEVLWTWGGGELQAQHDATQLDNGNLLIFDNGTRREQSRAIELDASSGEIVWSYTHEELYTPLRGGAQRLPNDNVLLTEADSGHAVEVTRDGRVVWELWNPDVRGRGERAERAVIYRLNRFEASFFEPL